MCKVKTVVPHFNPVPKLGYSLAEEGLIVPFHLCCNVFFSSDTFSLEEKALKFFMLGCECLVIELLNLFRYIVRFQIRQTINIYKQY